MSPARDLEPPDGDAPARDFADAEDARRRLGDEAYVASPEIGTVVFLAGALGKPILAEGPAGTGKTELAKAWAAAAGRRLIRLQCYEGLDESRALYEWEYAKQMLYTQLLRDALADSLAGARDLRDAAARLAAQEDVFFSEHFLLPRPLLAALTSEEPVLLLIDEVDRADVEFEAFLLELLSDFQVSIPELGTVTARQRPAVVLTSNSTRELSEALKRRCLYLHVDYPSMAVELEIVRRRVPGLDAELARQAVDWVQSLRSLELRKVPSIGETLDWARALLALNADRIDEATLRDTLNVLLKHEADLTRARRLMGPPDGYRGRARHAEPDDEAPRRPGAPGRGDRPGRGGRPDRPRGRFPFDDEDASRGPSRN